MFEKDLYDITIIGGGPVGLFAAFYAGMRHAKTNIIESLPQLGGQLSMLYPEKKIYDIAGFPDIKAQDLVNNLLKQIERFDQTTHLEEEVIHIEKMDDGILEIETNKGIHYSKSVIITAGNGAFQPRRLDLEHAHECEGLSLHYYITNSAAFTDQDIVVLGGGDSAIDWSLMLEPIAKSVTLIHRRPEFRAHEHSVHLLQESTVTIKTPFVLDQITQVNGLIKEVSIKKPKSDETETLKADAIIVNHGFSSSLGSMKKWGLEFQKNSILVNSDMSTNIPGVYAAGDICTYEGKVNLIATGFGEAPTAVNNAMHFIQPNARTQPVHSTSFFETKEH